MDGWIKLHRSLLESAAFQDPEVLKVWIYILLSACHKNQEIIYNGNVISLKSGQLLTGRKKIAKDTNLKENRAYRALKILQKLGNIDIKPNNKFSLVTVIKWDFFQSDFEKVNSKPTTNQQQTNSKLTADQQQTNSKRTQYKNVKNVNNEKNEKNIPALAEEKPKRYDEQGRELNEKGYPVLKFDVDRWDF